MVTRFWKVGLVLALAAPAVVARLAGLPLPPWMGTLVFGGGVVAASILLAWTAEVAQLDVSMNVATALLALITVLPEYAVDLYFAYTAGHRPDYAAYAAANMTGSNRLLIGIGWPLVALLYLWASARRGERVDALTLDRGRRIDVGFLGVACAYAFVVPIKGTIALYDSLILIVLFALYVWRVSKEGAEEPELVGMAARIGELPARARRLFVFVFFAYAALVIFCSAKPFADGLVETGEHLGIDEFLLVQWFAPLASEAPELLVAGLLAVRAKQDAALGALLSSKVNQWTLLVGSLPLAYTLGGGGGTLALDARQNDEFLLTASQALFGFAVLANLKLERLEAVLLFGLFVVQLLVPWPEARVAFAALYAVLSAVFLLWHRKELPKIARDAFGGAHA